MWGEETEENSLSAEGPLDIYFSQELWMPFVFPPMAAALGPKHTTAQMIASSLFTGAIFHLYQCAELGTKRDNWTAEGGG